MTKKVKAKIKPKSDRKIIRQTVTEFSTYDIQELITGNLSDIIQKVSEAQAKCISSGFQNVKLEIEQHYEDTDFSLVGEREETDDEYEKRKKREASAAKAKLTRLAKNKDKRAAQEIRDKAEYDRLKKVFGDK